MIAAKSCLHSHVICYSLLVMRLKLVPGRSLGARNNSPSLQYSISPTLQHTNPFFPPKSLILLADLEILKNKF